MKVTNRSAFHKTTSIQRVVDFVRAKTKHTAQVHLELHDNGLGAHVTGGFASGRKGDSGGICLTLSRGLPYPHVMYHPQRSVARAVGAIRVNSWEEEVVVVLAHEGRHIDQFFQNKFFKSEEEAAEIDAERFAKRTLNAWRRAVVQ